MKLNALKPANGSTKKEMKRIGRGQGSGKGGTSTKGHKGAQSRSGYNRKRAHEGGQTPIQRRLPKFGFVNLFRIEFRGINLDMIQKLAESKKIENIDPAILAENGLSNKRDRVKILGRGELKAKVNIKAHAFSASAKAAIEAKKGTASVIQNEKK